MVNFMCIVVFLKHDDDWKPSDEASDCNDTCVWGGGGGSDGSSVSGSGRWSGNYSGSGNLFCCCLKPSMSACQRD